MTPWGGGYVTDVAYIPAFHKIEAQALAATAALLNGVQARIAGRDDNLHFVDIGCGHGVTALIVAAANPGWRVTGLDFMPAHIAAARETARLAGIDNITFVEADLRDFAGSPAARALPDFGAVTMHGVWSWVAQPVRDGVVRLLAEKLVPGGQLHISYNQATGWQNQLGMQRFMRAAGLRLASRSDAQAAAGFAAFQDLLKAEGSERLQDTLGPELRNTLASLPDVYLAHEFMNANWTPVMHEDVVAALADAKLDFCGTARLIDNFPQLVLSEAQRAVLARFDDPLMTELFKDVCRPRQLRNDIFIRGARRLVPGVRAACLNDVTLALQTGEDDWRFSFDTGFGKAQLAEPYYRRIFTRLKSGPAKVRELLALPELADGSHDPAELIGVGVGTEQLAILPNPGAVMDATCRRLNTLLLQRQLEAGQPDAILFASPAIGGGMSLPKLEGFLTHELMTAPDSTRDQLADRLGVPTDSGQRAAFAARLESYLAHEAPLLRHLGFLLPV